MNNDIMFRHLREKIHINKRQHTAKIAMDLSAIEERLLANNTLNSRIKNGRPKTSNLILEKF
jgi:hypothetical protein